MFILLKNIFCYNGTVVVVKPCVLKQYTFSEIPAKSNPVSL